MSSMWKKMSFIFFSKGSLHKVILLPWVFMHKHKVLFYVHAIKRMHPLRIIVQPICVVLWNYEPVVDFFKGSIVQLLSGKIFNIIKIYEPLIERILQVLKAVHLSVRELPAQRTTFCIQLLKTPLANNVAALKLHNVFIFIALQTDRTLGHFSKRKYFTCASCLSFYERVKGIGLKYFFLVFTPGVNVKLVHPFYSWECRIKGTELKEWVNVNYYRAVKLHALHKVNHHSVSHYRRILYLPLTHHLRDLHNAPISHVTP